MVVLGIESSCDETAAAVLSDGRRILSSVVASQDDVHAPYGGVVPELASRRHIEVIVPVIERALDQAHVRLADLDGIAVTHGPGLVGSLLVGTSLAKALAWAHGLPLVGVNHLEGHIYASFLSIRFWRWSSPAATPRSITRARRASTRCWVRRATTPPARRSTRSPSCSASAFRAGRSCSVPRSPAIRPPSRFRRRA